MCHLLDYVLLYRFFVSSSFEIALIHYALSYNFIGHNIFTFNFATSWMPFCSDIKLLSIKAFFELGKIIDRIKEVKATEIIAATWDQASLTRYRFIAIYASIPFWEYKPELIISKSPSAINNPNVKKWYWCRNQYKGNFLFRNIANYSQYVLDTHQICFPIPLQKGHPSTLNEKNIKLPKL